MSGRFFGTAINIVLTCLFYFPGLIHAWIILTKDQNAIADAIKEASVAQMKAQEEKVKAETSLIKEQAKAESKVIKGQAEADIKLIQETSEANKKQENVNVNESELDSIGEKIELLKKMLDKGLINQEEYDSKKKDLLDKL